MNGVFGEKEKCTVVCYDKRHLKPPGPEKVSISPPLSRNMCKFRVKIIPFINRPGVAGDVVQSPPSFIN